MSIAEKLTAIAENEHRVFEAGKKSEYDKFWDAFQQNGNRVRYDMENGNNFSYQGWDFTNFYPKYDIKPTRAMQLFYNWSEERHQGDLAQRLEDCGVVLDTSQCISMYAAFQYCRCSRIPPIDFTGITSSSGTRNVFANTSMMVTIDKLIVNDNTSFDLTFISNYSLENITIEGTIGQNGFDVSSCSKLTHTSLMSIINALKTFTDGTNKSVTIGSTNLAKLTDAEKAIATQKGWTLA